jgi:hypothetical protein
MEHNPERELAMNLIYAIRLVLEETGSIDEFMDAWISSRVLPLVSGTSRSTNKTVSPLMLANMKNVPAINPRYEQKTSATPQQRCTPMMLEFIMSF